jgi:hypothetical protein
MTEPLRIKPSLTCKACLGTGEANDFVPYGMGSVPMPTICDCVLEQIPEGREDEEIELDLTEYREEQP